MRQRHPGRMLFTEKLGLDPSRLWLVFFAFFASVAALVQFILLPYLFPAWHAGDGLMVGGDSLRFHRLALSVVERISREGWSAWELRPEGQAPAGIAAALYVLIAAKPWTLIPLNAALHATAGVVLLRIVQQFVPDWRRAVWAVFPFLIYPSAMNWYTQMLKDGYAIAGSLLFLYGWILLAGAETWQGGWRLPLRGTLWVFLGAGCAWIVRPYQVQMMLGLGAVLALLLTGVFLVRAVRSGLAGRRLVLASALLWIILVGLTPLTWGGVIVEVAQEGASGVPVSSAWQASRWLPSVLDRQFQAMALVRDSSRTDYPLATSNLDTDVGFRSAADVMAYLPRAGQIVFLAPFPNDWFRSGQSRSATMMRRISAMEMSGVYVSLALLPFAIRRWFRRLELWVILVFCTGMMLVYGLSIVNVGTLYRVRYGYLMTLVALSIAGVLARRDVSPGFPYNRRRRRGEEVTG